MKVSLYLLYLQKTQVKLILQSEIEVTVPRIHQDSLEKLPRRLLKEIEFDN